MRRLVCVLLAGCAVLWGCSQNSETRFSDLGPESRVESSALLQNLDDFNAKLSEQCDVARLYDFENKDLVGPVATRGINWRQFWLADAVGAWKGGKAGFMYGSAFSPSGAIAGAIVGGVLTGAIASGIDYWVQDACV